MESGSTKPRPEEEAGEKSWRDRARDARGGVSSEWGMHMWVEMAEREASRRRRDMVRVRVGV